MTIEQAIAIIHQEYLCVDRDCNIEKNCGKCDLAMPSKEPILEAYKIAIKALEQEQSRSENLNGWIPVSEMLPPDDEDVLVQYEQGVMEVVYHQTYHNLNETGWFNENGDALYFEPVAWMPLPEPYKATPTGAESDKV